MTTYSRNNAYLRFHYDESHPNAYGYLYAPAGGFGAWVGARPWWGNVHGGGFSQPGYDENNERNPAAQMVQSSPTLDAFQNAGAAIIVFEYPLGYHPGDRSGRGVAMTKFPETWQVLARGIQFVKDQAREVGGIFYGLIDPDDCGALVNSAGAMTMMSVQWCPESWGMFPRAPGDHVALGHIRPKSNHRLKCMVLTGPSPNTGQDDPSRAISNAYAPLTVVLESTYHYRPRISFTATHSSGTLPVVGERLIDNADATHQLELAAISGSGPYDCEALVVEGISTDLAGSEQLNGTAGSLTLTAAPYTMDRHGWLQVPRAHKNAMSPILLLNECNEDDLDLARQCHVYATVGTNPTVQFNPSDPEYDMVPNKYGVDDGYDIPLIAYKLGQLGGFTVETYWGEDADVLPNPRVSQQISNATNTSPIVVTVGEEHGIQTGDLIQVGQVVGNTAANANWVATRISSTTFSLQGSVGNGAYVSGGCWVFRNTGGNLASQSSAAKMVLFAKAAGMALA